MRIRVGTRGSELALTQTRAMILELRGRRPDLDIEEVILRTSGDKDQVTPLAEQGGVGVFTKELERALLDGEIDVAVHSLKDLPTTSPEGLALAAVPLRASPWDAFISERYPDLVDLPPGSVVATGSLRRQAQILHAFPRLKVQGIRGNIDTRLARYQDEGAAALVLAEAGLVRTGRVSVIRAVFGPTEMTPAPGQGALGLEVRAGEPELAEAMRAVEDPATRQAVTAERAFLAELEGGCHLPIGALARVTGEQLVLTGTLLAADGSARVQLAVEGPSEEPERIAHDLVSKLRRAGGDEILASYRELGR